MTSSSHSSLDDEVTKESSMIFRTNGMLISTDDLERGESSKGKCIRRNCVYK